MIFISKRINSLFIYLFIYLIENWLAKYDLTNNFRKMRQMYYKKKNVHVCVFPFTADIEIVHFHKYLDVILEDDFSLEKHLILF